MEFWLKMLWRKFGVWKDFLIISQLPTYLQADNEVGETIFQLRSVTVDHLSFLRLMRPVKNLQGCLTLDFAWFGLINQQNEFVFKWLITIDHVILFFCCCCSLITIPLNAFLETYCILILDMWQEWFSHENNTLTMLKIPAVYLVNLPLETDGWKDNI